MSNQRDNTLLVNIEISRLTKLWYRKIFKYYFIHCLWCPITNLWNCSPNLHTIRNAWQNETWHTEQRITLPSPFHYPRYRSRYNKGRIYVISLDIPRVQIQRNPFCSQSSTISFYIGIKAILNTIWVLSWMHKHVRYHASIFRCASRRISQVKFLTVSRPVGKLWNIIPPTGAICEFHIIAQPP